MLNPIIVSDTLTVAPQPEPSDMAVLAEQGFTTVVCNRPDGEAPDQPTMASMAQAAEAAGLKFVAYPVNPNTFPGEDLEGLGQIFNSGEKVFAYCRTGTRCTNLWVASQSGTDREAAVAQARALGFDLSLAQRLGL